MHEMHPAKRGNSSFYYTSSIMLKSLRYIMVIVVCITILFFWYHWYSTQQAKKQYIDLTKTTIVMQLESLNNIETASMTLQKTVEGKNWLKDLIPNSSRDNVVQNFLFEDTIELIATAKITAWFDLSKINSWSVLVNKDDMSVTLILPKAEVLQYSLTPDTKPFLRKRWILNAWDIALETEVRNQTLEKMKQEAIDKWLLQAAEKNANAAFKAILGSFGVNLNNVVIQ